MSKIPPQRLEVLKDLSLSSSEAAKKLGTTRTAVRSARTRLVEAGELPRHGRGGKVGFKKESPTAKAVHTTLDTDKAALDQAYWRNQYADLYRQHKEALEGLVATDRLVLDIKDMAPKSYSTAPRMRLAKPDKEQTAESAVLLFSDTHIGKVTRPEQTLGFSVYNFEEFLNRLKLVENSVISILTKHTNSPLNELVVAMMGDMLDGTLAHGSEAAHRNAKFNQFFAGGHAIAQFFRNLAAHVPTLRIETVVGNHTRFPDQKKMPTENRYSNFDMFLYAFVQALTRDIPNIHWNLNEQPFAVFTVEGKTFFASHGDNLKGGDKAMGIPLHAMARQLNSTTQLFVKHGEVVPDYYILGHFHRPIQIPTGFGDFTINGGFPGLDGYALDGNFNPVDPMQTFFKVHPKYGKICEYKLHLKHAKPGDHYDIPGAFPCE